MKTVRAKTIPGDETIWDRIRTFLTKIVVVIVVLIVIYTAIDIAIRIKTGNETTLKDLCSEFIQYIIGELIRRIGGDGKDLIGL